LRFASLVERKLVTTLFCDLVGSTALGEALDPEGSAADPGELLRADGGGRRRVRRQEKFIGDAVVAVFGVPKIHEDDAIRALGCALAMREAVRGLNDTLRPRFGVELAIRVGVATGEAIAGGHEGALATGDVMNAAARLEQAADPGEILVGREAMLLTQAGVAYEAVLRARTAIGSRWQRRRRTPPDACRRRRTHDCLRPYASSIGASGITESSMPAVSGCSSASAAPTVVGDPRAGCRLPLHGLRP